MRTHHGHGQKQNSTKQSNSTLKGLLLDIEPMLNFQLRIELRNYCSAHRCLVRACER
jgi:hypothetical protein